MNIQSKAIVSNSDMIKNYKACREKAEVLGKIFVLKNNQLDAVLLSISEYEKLSEFIEHMESLDEDEIKRLAEALIYEENIKQSDTSDEKDNNKN